jgi:protein-tyrosine phosphatase
MPAGPYWIDTGQSGRLAILSRPRGGDWLEDEARAWSRAGFDTVVSLLEPDEAVGLDLAGEEQASQAAGVSFVSLPVPDRGVPESRQAVAELAGALAEAVASGKRVGLHCRQGVGRSALLAACVLIALGVDPAAALARVAAARGLPVPETPEQRQWVMDFARRTAAPI